MRAAVERGGEGAEPFLACGVEEGETVGFAADVEDFDLGGGGGRRGCQ